MSQNEVITFGSVILGSLFLLIIAFWVAHKIFNQPWSPCPYTGKPLRLCRDLSYYTKEQILRHLFFMRHFDNRIFDIDKAVFCRDTGKIFIDCLTWYDVVKIDWNFLKKRYPGNWVSWGSLNENQQEAIRAAHHKIEGYQMGLSSPAASPNNILEECAYLKPGPLYVDLETKILLGWKEVPDTDFELLIVTKPKGIFEAPKR